MTYLLPFQLRRKWERLGRCAAHTMLAGIPLYCNQIWHPPNTPHRHDELTWDWGEPPFED